MAFCQYGGHDSAINPRKGGNLTTIPIPDNQTNATLSWRVCDECKNKLEGTQEQDPTMDILLLWANEVSSVNQLPGSVRDNSLKEALLVQYVDHFLNKNMRIKFGNRFPFFLIDICEKEKKYFLSELTKQCVISDIFLTDIQIMDERTSISLKLWAGATIAAKGTRATFNVSGGQQPYTITQRVQAFKAIRKYVKKDAVLQYITSNDLVIKIDKSSD